MGFTVGTRHPPLSGSPFLLSDTRDQHTQGLGVLIPPPLSYTGPRGISDLERDVTEVAAVCGGEGKPTNHHRALLTALLKDRLPAAWGRGPDRLPV